MRPEGVYDGEPRKVRSTHDIEPQLMSGYGSKLGSSASNGPWGSWKCGDEGTEGHTVVVDRRGCERRVCSSFETDVRRMWRVFSIRYTGRGNLWLCAYVDSVLEKKNEMMGGWAWKRREKGEAGRQGGEGV